jgi:hypothetical protein
MLMTPLDLPGRALALGASALLILAMSAPLAPGARVALAQTQPPDAQQPAGESAEQRGADAQATEAAAQQAVSNELQQTENLEFQTLNEDRPPSFQQPEP